MGNDNFNEALASIMEESTTPDEAGTETTVEESEPQEQSTVTTDNATKTQTEQPTTAEPQKIKVRYNHEDKELTYEEAVAFAQKGMRYDDENVAETMKQVKELAKANGFESVNDYIQQVSRNARENQAKALAERENIPESVAQQIIAKNEQIRQLQQAQTAKTTQDANQQKIFAEIDELREMYPDADVRSLPREVYEAKARRPEIPLAYHYARHLETEQRNAAAVRKKAEENAQSSAGSMRDTSTDTVNEEDALISKIFP